MTKSVSSRSECEKNKSADTLKHYKECSRDFFAIAELTSAFYSAAVDHVRRRLCDRRPIYQEVESRLADLLNSYLRWSASGEFRQPFHQSCDVYAGGPAASRCDQLKEPGRRATDVVVTIGGSAQ